MKEKSIILYQHEVRGVLQGRQMRITRIVRNASDIIQDWDKHDKDYGPFFQDEFGETHKTVEAAPYQVGMRLWVRETCLIWTPGGQDVVYSTEPDYEPCKRDMKTLNSIPRPDGIGNYKVVPSIHMPKWASRLSLEVVGVRVERVKDISMQDVIAEGCMLSTSKEEPLDFQNLWSSIHGPSSWAANPFCWVYNIKRVEER